MSQPLTQRLNYHPDHRDIVSGDRKVLNRFDYICRNVDFSDKIVLDLGCSGGFFSFSLSKFAKKVYAIDGDIEVIRRNKEIQTSLGIHNVEFIHGSISSELIQSIGSVDITLFLSVYHHMLSISDAYDWNIGMSDEDTEAIITSINDITNIFIFEIGYPNEGYEWCERLPRYAPDWDTYIIRKIFRDCYNAVQMSNPRCNLNWISHYIVSRLSTPYKRDTWLINKIKSLFGFDSRDLRKIYIGYKLN